MNSECFMEALNGMVGHEVAVAVVDGCHTGVLIGADELGVVLECGERKERRIIPWTAITLVSLSDDEIWLTDGEEQ